MLIRHGNVERVCILDSSYSLLLYFLLSTVKEIYSTFFFWGNGVPQNVREKFPNSKYIPNGETNPKWKLMSRKYFFWQLYYYYCGSYIDFPFLKKKGVSYWGHDHLYFSRFIIHSNNFNAIEDGMLNYTPQPQRVTFPYLRKVLFGGPLAIRHKYRYQQETCEKEYLTGLIPNSQTTSSSKAVVMSLKELWNMQTPEKIYAICKFYDLTTEEIQELKSYNAAVLTQPFSEDGDFTEDEKIEMYREQIGKIKESHILIKPHPRETTEYEKYFPGVYVFNKKIPVELLTLLGIDFGHVYTVYSTGAYNLSKNVTMWGTEINSKLLNKHPRMTTKYLIEQCNTKIQV